MLQDRIRAHHRDLLRMARRVHPVPKVMEYLAQGITSKSSRTRVESTEAMCELLAEEGLAVFERTREKPFPAIAQVKQPSVQPSSCEEVIITCPFLLLCEWMSCSSSLTSDHPT